MGKERRDILSGVHELSDLIHCLILYDIMPKQVYTLHCFKGI